MKVLGISGKRGTGKSLLADYLQRNHGFMRVSLANPLKEMCKREYGLTDDQVYGSLKESPTQYRRTDGSFFTPRDIMIREGCLKRSINPDFWLEKVYFTINVYSKHISHAVDKFVIDDIRFKNEVNWLSTKLNAKFARIERKSALNIYKAAMDDLSESELDTVGDWDFFLSSTKNKTPKDLERFAAYVAKHC